MNPMFIAAFVAFDLAVTGVVLWVIFKRRAALGMVGGIDLGAIRTLSLEMEPLVEEYLRANWSGDPSTLSGPLTELLGQFQGRAEARGVLIDRNVLKLALARLIEAKHLAKGHEIREAMRNVA